MASLENRGGGSWRVVICSGYDARGRKNRLQRTIKVDPGKTINAQRKEVEKQAALIEADFRRHILTDAGKTRFETVAAEYLDSKQITETTKAGYRVLLNGRILPGLGRCYVQDLTPAVLRRFFKDLSQAEALTSRSKTGKLSGNTQLHYYRVVNAIMNFAIKSGYITVNPMAAVDAPKKDTPETAFYEPEECAALLDVLDNLTDPMWTAFFYLSLYSCCRPGELIGANWSDLRGNVLTIAHGAAFITGKGTVRTPAPKTASSKRDIVLPPEAMEPLRKWKTAQAEYRLKFGAAWPEPDAIFTGDTGCRLHISSPTQKFQKILKANNLRHITLYGLRHTGASLLIQAGEDPRTVADRLGHSTPLLTLSTYSHAFESAKQRTADAISAALAEARKKAK